METFLYFLIPLCTGWLLDKLLGDQSWLPHPVAGFGKLIAFGERRLNKRTFDHPLPAGGEVSRGREVAACRIFSRRIRINRDNGRVVRGGMLSVVLIAGTFAVTSCLLSVLRGDTVRACAADTGGNTDITVFWRFFHAALSPVFRPGDAETVTFWVSVAAASVFVFYGLAGKTLISEVREVFRACDRSPDEGRRQVARIVGRDTSRLSVQEVRTAALETLAENMSDGVVAPLFWYMIFGAPGMMAYKMMNTLDSMIGYRNERYRLFGRVAARIDDAANYLPARLTAILMILVSGQWPLFAFVKKYGNQHASPNAGYPEAALAALLNCRFGGPHDYFGQTVNKPFIGANPRLLTGEDLRRSVGNAQRTELLAVVICIATLCFSCCFYGFGYCSPQG